MEKKLDEKWGVLYEDLREEDNLSIQYYYMYALRRMLFVLIVYFLNPYPGIQIMILDFLMLAVLIFLIFA